MKRISIATLLLCASTGSSACASSPEVQHTASDFNGAWSVKLCDESDPKRQCGTFDLYLVQDESGRICGEHFVATPGLARLDESDPATVLGTSGPGGAVVVIRSTRNEARYMGALSMDGDRLHWNIVGMLSRGLNDEPPIIPVEKTLERSESSEKRQYQRDIVASCEWPDWVP